MHHSINVINIQRHIIRTGGRENHIQAQYKHCEQDEIHSSMEQSSSWEGNISSASQEITRILQHPNVHYRVDKTWH
jgi:hypothetical protein